MVSCLGYMVYDFENTGIGFREYRVHGFGDPGVRGT